MMAGATPASRTMARPTRHAPLTTKLSYGLAAATYGIKDTGFSTFLLLFYNLAATWLRAEQVGW